MDDKERRQLLVDMRRKFREDHPELHLTPAAKNPEEIAEARREQERRELIKAKRDSIAKTAGEHPGTIARLLKKYTGLK